MQLLEADFHRQCKEPMRHQQELLLDILRAHHGVDALQGMGPPADIEDAVNMLSNHPLTTYSDYETAIQAVFAAAELGSDDDFRAACKRISGAPIQAFHLTSGTTSASKVFPATDLALLASRAAFSNLDAATKAKFPPPPGAKTFSLLLAGRVTTLVNGLQVGAASAVNLRRMAAMVEPASAAASAGEQRTAAPYNPWTTPMPVVIGDGTTEARYYCAWLCALAHASAVYKMSDIFAGNLLHACGVLQSQWRSLAADLRAGSLSPDVAVDGGARDAVNAQLGGPCDESSRKVEAAFAAASDSGGLLEQLFPNLQHIETIVTGSHAKYVPQLRQLAPTVPFISGLYGATEGMIGINYHVLKEGPWDVQPGKDGEQAYVLFPRCDSYLEFMLVGSDDATAAAPKLLTMAELHMGGRYLLVVTSLRGLFRYKINEEVEVVGFYERTPVVTFKGRAGQVLNLAWEKTTECQLVAALAAALPPLHDFTCAEDTADSEHRRYIVYIELPASQPLPTDAQSHPSSIANTAADVSSSSSSSSSSLLVAQWAAALQEALCKENAVYGMLVSSRAIAPVMLRVVSAGTFVALKAAKLGSGGGSEGQYKTPTVLQAPELLQLMEVRTVVQAGGGGVDGGP